MKYQLLIVCLLGLLLAPVGSWAGAADISGTWEFSVSMEDARGPQNALSTLVLKQEGEKVTGAQGENKITGTVKGNKVVLNVEGKNRSGDPYKNTFIGTIESSTKMSGAVEFVKGPARWTAAKK